MGATRRDRVGIRSIRTWAVLLFILSGTAFSAPAAGAAEKKPLPVKFCDQWRCQSKLVASDSSGSHVVFSTFDTLLPADRFEGLDLYERVNGQLRLVSKRPVRRSAADRDRGYLDIKLRSEKNGKPRAIFATEESLLPVDRDLGPSRKQQSIDIYEYVDGKLRLLTHAPAFPKRCSGGPCDFFLLDVGADGRTVYLSTHARLSPEDRDSRRDIYAVAGNERTLVTGGPRPGGGNAVDIPRDNYNDPPYRIYEDGSVAFTTRAALTRDDNNTMADAYLFRQGETELLSPPRPTGADNWAIGYLLSDTVPGRIFPLLNELSYETPAPPGRVNLYRVDPGSEPELVYSADPDHTHFQYTTPEFVLDRPDGTIYFRTADRIDPLDTDDKPDLYAWEDGTLTMISIGPRGSEGPGNRPDGDYSRYVGMRDDGLYFLSDQRLVFEDRHFDGDLYRYSEGEVTLISTDRHGNALNGGVDSVRMLDDGGIVMNTRERWVPADRNRVVDLYLRRGDEVLLISPTGQTQRRTIWDWTDLGQHLGDNRFVFESQSALVATDGDESDDVYFSQVGPGQRALRLVSRGKLEILVGPPATVSQADARARFIFAQQGPRPRFICSLDERPARPCKSPVTYRNLKPGKHSFAVASVGPRGLGREAARSRFFKVSRDNPPVSLETAAVSADGNRAVAVRTSGYSRHPDTRIYRTGTEPAITYHHGAGGRFVAADPALERVVVGTNSRIDWADDDATTDFYGWWGEAPFLLPGAENVFGPPEALLASDDLKTVAFETFARLAPADLDYGVDVYSWGPNGYRLHSGGNALESPARLAGQDALSGDGSSVVFSTREALLPEDADDQSSLYWSDGDSILYLVRDGIPRQEDGDWVLRDRPSVVSLSGDGRRVILEMSGRLVTGNDNDWPTRVYEWAADGSPPLREIRMGTVATNIGNPMIYPRAVSEDASTVLVHDREDWRPGLLFRSSGNNVEPVYPPKPQMKMYLNASNTDLSAIAVDTGAALDPEDMNGTIDTYLLAGDSATWLTRRTGVGDRRRASVLWLSATGDEALFFTKAPLLPSDRDKSGVDFYRFADGKLRLLSSGDRFPERQTRDYPSAVRTSADGAWIYFTSEAALLRSDRPGTLDIYRIGRNGELELMPAPRG